VAPVIITVAFGWRCIPPGRRCSSVTNSPICSLVAPCQPGASAPSVHGRMYDADHLVEEEDLPATPVEAWVHDVVED